jgi:branched-chain amino acid transport system substrate-binding protein
MKLDRLTIAAAVQRPAQVRSDRRRQAAANASARSIDCPGWMLQTCKQDEAGSIKTYAAHASSRGLFVFAASAMGGSPMSNASRIHVNRRALLKGAAAGTAAALAAPMVIRAEAKSIKIGMSTILSGRVAQLGTSSRNAVMMEVEKINGAGGLAGRQIEMVIRDSKGQPQEAARLARELINTDGCEILIDAEASSGAFAVHEVARDLGMLCLHTNSETSSLTADPKLRLPNAFRTCRQGVHDSIAGGAYAANIAKAKNLSKWMTASPDYAYGRDTTAEYMTYVKHFKPDVELVGESWPKLFQPDYTEILTKILQTKPQVLYTCLWGGDITAFIDQGNIYALFGQTETFAVNMADYTALTAVKNLPKGIHSGNRYIKTFPNTPENAAWGDAYRAKYNEYPTNWSWENATAIQFLAAAAKQANSTDGAKLAEVLKGLTIPSPFGADGKLTLRADDHTLVGYAIGWGTTLPNEPYIADMVPGDWNQIFPLEAEWKKSKNFT